MTVTINGLYLGKGIQDKTTGAIAMINGVPIGTVSLTPITNDAKIYLPFTTLDLSRATQYTELVCALISFGHTDQQVNIVFNWYRDSDGALLFSYAYTIPASPYGTYYTYWWVTAWIGYVPAEIWQNGSYHVDCICSPGGTFTKSFTITGIPAPPAPTLVSIRSNSC